MDHQTQMNGNGAAEPPAHAVARSASDLWHHVLTLGELQTRLLAVELGQAMGRARTAALLVAAGAVLAVASLPVILACLALVLVEVAGMTAAGAFGIVSGLAVVVSVALVAVGWRQLRQNSDGVSRSREEWRRNWSWLKETLRRERPAAERSRASANRSN